ncbi:winged helix-turn-helix domain-containing protein [Halobellus inordinatus]|uniref:winged helix-turn-helix domain-containing protein n=1 Tax=Halobellus inordinatus TaxID=1126236 RepID=UPI00210D3B6B|nr:winged helix-turn-helix domain-containing protein [Halobellus inordinatus]
MLQSANWMIILDERILEHLNEGPELTAWEIAVDLDGRAALVRQRCEILAEAGFLHRRRRDGLDDRYSITTDGHLYLEGELDANLRRPIPAPRPPHAVRPGWWAGFG